MTGKNGKEIAKKRKAVAATRARIGWTRTNWINEVEDVLGEAFIIFAKAKLAEKNGQKRLAKGWAMEFDRKLHVGMITVAIHPVKRNFDRKVAFEQAITEMDGTIESLWAHVEREYTKAVGGVRRGLDGRDIELFWRMVREGAKILAG